MFTRQSLYTEGGPQTRHVSGDHVGDQHLSPAGPADPRLQNSFDPNFVMYPPLESNRSIAGQFIPQKVKKTNRRNMHLTHKSKMVPGYFKKYIQNYFDENDYNEDQVVNVQYMQTNLPGNFADHPITAGLGPSGAGSNLEMDFVPADYNKLGVAGSYGSRSVPGTSGTLAERQKQLSDESKNSGLLPNAQQVFEKSLHQDSQMDIDPDLVNWVEGLDDEKLEESLMDEF